MSDHQALPTGPVMESYTRLIQSPVIKKEITKQDRIADLAGHEGWKAIVEDINVIVEHLQNLSINPQSDTPESVGFRYLVSSVAIQYLTSIRDRPDHYAKLKESQDEKSEN